MSGRDIDEFQNRLKAFVFFHLGSDAVVKVEEGPEHCRFRLAHPRIDAFEFLLAPGQMQILVRDEAQFEEFMLGHLTRHRR